ncbi:MAG: hypothetical protein R2792_14080 [Saprospiraceae bacterium]
MELADWENERSNIEHTETHPKTILNKVSSADIPMEWEPQPIPGGYEHGCVYYASEIPIRTGDIVPGWILNEKF